MTTRTMFRFPAFAAGLCLLLLSTSALAGGPDGAPRAWLAFGHIWTVATGDGAVARIERSAFVYDMLLSANGASLLVADSQGIHVYGAADGRRGPTIYTGPVFALARRADVIYAVSQDPVEPGAEAGTRKIVAIHAVTRALLAEFAVPKYVSSLTVSPSGDRIVALDLHSNIVNVYTGSGELVGAINMFKATDPADPASGTRDRTHDRLAPNTKALITADGARAIVVEVGGAKRPTTVWTIDLATLATGWIDLAHPANVRGAALSPDERHLYLNCVQHVSKVDLAERREIAWVRTSSTVNAQSAVLSPDGGSLWVCGSEVATNVETGEQKATGKLLEIGTADLKIRRTHTIADATPCTLVVAPH